MNRYTVDRKGVEHTCCNEARVVDTANGSGWDTVCDCQTEEIAQKIADALNAQEASLPSRGGHGGDS